MTTTTAVTGATAGATTNTTSTGSTNGTNAYSSDMFLKLLVTQLQNQDPSSPMDTSEMINQTSQLASMEQLTNLNTTTSDTYTMQMRQTAATMIGKTVSYTNASTGLAASSAVSSVSFTGTTPTLTLANGTTLSLTDVTGVVNSTSTTTGGTTSGS